MGSTLAKQEVDKLIKSIDVDGDNALDYNEFASATLQLHKVTLEDNMLKLFRYFDKDDSGFISRDELIQALNETGMNQQIDADELLEEVDKDNNGYVDYEEFVTAMKSRTDSELTFRDATRMRQPTLGV